MKTTLDWMPPAAVAFAGALVLAGCGSSDAPEVDAPGATESTTVESSEPESAKAQSVNLSQVSDDEVAMAEACAKLFGAPADIAPGLGLAADVAWAPEHDEIGLEECSLAPGNGLQSPLVTIKFATDEESGARIKAKSPDGIWVRAWYEDVAFDQIPGSQVEALKARVDAAAKVVKP